MTVVKTLQPPNVSPAGDPVLFGFTANDTIEQPGVRADFVLNIHYTPPVGYTFELYIGGMPYEFKFVDQPGNDPAELPRINSNASFGTWDGYVEQVKDEFLKHPHIAKHFDVSVLGGFSNPHIYFKAKQPGPAYTMEMGVGPGMPVSTNAAANIAGVEEIRRPFYSLYLQCYFDGEQVGEDLLSPDSHGNVIYDVSAYLKAHLRPSFTWPTTAHVMKRPELVKRFWVQYANRFGIPPKINKLQSTYKFISYAIAGGNGYMQQTQWSQQASSFWNSQQYSRRFLTHQPKEKLLKLDQIEKLFFLNHQHLTPLTLRCRMSFFGDPMTHHTVDLATIAVARYDMLEISFRLIDLLEQVPPPAGRLHSVKVVLVAADNSAVSETLTYLADPLAERHSHQFIWRNSFGVYDSDMFTGRHQQSVVSDKQIFTLTNRYSYSVTDAPTQVHRATEVERIGASTGWIEDTNRVTWLRELLMSKEVYEVIDGTLSPVVIISGDVDLITQGKTLHNVQLEYTRAYTDEHFSKVTGMASAKFIQSFNQANDPQFNPVQPVPTA